MNRLVASFKWVAWMLIGMGALFAIICGVVIGAVGANGSLPPEEFVRFRLGFSLGFGGAALGLLIAGAIVFAIYHGREMRARALVGHGHYVMAEVIGIQTSHVRTGHNFLLHLRASYQHTDGRTYIFRSPLLHYDPSAMLMDNQVKVYLDPQDIRRYFVDVLGSMQGNVVEL